MKWLRNNWWRHHTWQCFEDNLIGGYDLFGIRSDVQLGLFAYKDASLAPSPFLKKVKIEFQIFLKILCGKNMGKVVKIELLGKGILFERKNWNNWFWCWLIFWVQSWRTNLEDYLPLGNIFISRSSAIILITTQNDRISLSTNITAVNHHSPGPIPTARPSPGTPGSFFSKVIFKLFENSVA